MRGQLTERVLLVDDEPLVRKLVSRHLVAAGYVVRVADDGLDAIGKLRAGLPDLIISDLKMPRMSGVELLDVVRKRFPEIPVIVMSGVTAEELPPGLAADAYCYKHGSAFDQLLQTMSELTQKPPLRTALPHQDHKPSPAKCNGDGKYIIGCDDCLRDFTVPGNPGTVRGEKWATCVHCGKTVPFLVPESVAN
ncbi:MAG: response regulator [Terriglobia bacterium]